MQEGSEAVLVHYAHGRVCKEEQVNDLHMASVGGVVGGGGVEGIARTGVRAGSEQGLHYLAVAHGRAEHERSARVLVCALHVCALREEILDHGRVAALRRLVEGRATRICLARVHVRLVVQQQTDAARVAVLRSQMDGWHAVLVGRVHGHALVEEELHLLGLIAHNVLEEGLPKALDILCGHPDLRPPRVSARAQLLLLVLFLVLLATSRCGLAQLSARLCRLLLLHAFLAM
mmetsp:Transcript_15178/g.59396  ORF Transcript_15178/g.59396 Transcript_15178/m.59396 type:complete len:232 (-) Transcript_15178:70-765(-)